MFVRAMLVAVASVLMITGASAQDGARAYHLLPQDTNILSLTATHVHTEIQGSVFDANVLTPSYRRSVDIAGNAGTILIGMPVGSLSAALSTPVGSIDLHTEPAQGDLFLGGVLGLLGSPSLSPQEFAQYKPGFRASVAARLFLPTGDYDSSRVLNLGGNRWSLQAALPISYVLGDTMVDPDLTTFEIVPVVQIFGDNEDPFGPATVSSQDAVFGVEGHITRNFGRTFWASLDGAYEFGGETSADGVDNGDAQEALALGATIGLSLTPSVTLRLSYDEVVYSSEPNLESRSFRASSAFRF